MREEPRDRPEIPTEIARLILVNRDIAARFAENLARWRKLTSFRGVKERSIMLTISSACVPIAMSGLIKKPGARRHSANTKRIRG